MWGYLFVNRLMWKSHVVADLNVHENILNVQTSFVKKIYLCNLLICFLLISEWTLEHARLKDISYFEIYCGYFSNTWGLSPFCRLEFCLGTPLCSLKIWINIDCWMYAWLDARCCQMIAHEWDHISLCLFWSFTLRPFQLCWLENCLSPEQEFTQVDGTPY